MTEHRPSQDSWLGRLQENPVFLREKLKRERGTFNRTMKIIYAIFGGLMLLTLCGTAASVSGNSGSAEAFPYAILFAVIMFQLFITLFFVPPFTAGAISDERKKQTFDLLMTTTISPKEIIDGKLFSSVPFTSKLVFFSGLALVFAIPGEEIYIGQIFASQLIIFVTLMLLSAYSLFLSTVIRSTLYVLITVYATAVAFVIGTAILEVLWLDNFNADGPFGVNLIFALVATFIPDTLFNIINPAVYSLCYILLAYVFYRLSLLQVKKIANR